MDKGIFYSLFFTGIFLNYFIKLDLEREGDRLKRSNIREGVIMGVCAYVLYLAVVFPGIPISGRLVVTVLGLSSLIAGGVFFVTGKLRQDKD